MGSALGVPKKNDKKAETSKKVKKDSKKVNGKQEDKQAIDKLAEKKSSESNDIKDSLKTSEEEKKTIETKEQNAKKKDMDSVPDFVFHSDKGKLSWENLFSRPLRFTIRKGYYASMERQLCAGSTHN